MKFTAEFDSIDELLEFAQRINGRQTDALLDFLKETRTQAKQEAPVESVEETIIPEVRQSKPIISTNRTVKLKPLEPKSQELDKFFEKWHTKFGSKTVLPYQLVALAKEHNLFRSTPLWSTKRRGPVTYIGRKVSNYLQPSPQNKYFINKDYKTVKKGGKMTRETRYHLIPNESYTNGLHPKKVELKPEQQFPSKWLRLLENHIESKTSFKMDQIMDPTESMDTRLSFGSYLRSHPNLRWDVDRCVYEVVRSGARV